MRESERVSKPTPKKRQAKEEKYPENQLRFNLGLKINLTGSCAYLDGADRGRLTTLSSSMMLRNFPRAKVDRKICFPSSSFSLVFLLFFAKQLTAQETS